MDLIIGAVLAVFSFASLHRGGWLWPCLAVLAVFMMILGFTGFAVGFWKAFAAGAKAARAAQQSVLPLLATASLRGIGAPRRR